MLSNRTSFVVITDPRSGSEWFMEMLDQHNEICASGEKDDSAVGFPREALIPARYHYMAAQRKAAAAGTSAAKARASMIQSRTMFSSLGGLSVNALSMLITNGTRRMHTNEEMHRHGAYESSNYYSKYASDVPESVDGEELIGIRTCQAKAACSWGNIAPLVWRAAGKEDTCAGSKADWMSRSASLGYGMHLGMVCQMVKDAESTITGRDGKGKVTQSTIVAEAFRIYFRQQMRDQLHLNDAAYGSELESKQLLPCRCPKSAVTTGQKLMNEWIGDLPEGGAAATDWKNRPYDVNFNAKGATERLGAPYIDIFGAMKEVGTGAIIFHRANLLARFVSLQTAGKSNIYHCDDEKCVTAAVQNKVTVDIAKLMHFIEWNEEVQRRNLETLQSQGIPVITISYEDCRMDTQTCLEKVTDFLHVTKPTEDLAAMAKGRKLIGNLAEQILNADEVRQALTIKGHQNWIDDANLSML